MTVAIVFEHDWEDKRIAGVFSTIEKADYLSAALTNDASTMEYPGPGQPRA